MEARLLKCTNFMRADWSDEVMVEVSHVMTYDTFLENPKDDEEEG